MPAGQHSPATAQPVLEPGTSHQPLASLQPKHRAIMAGCSRAPPLLPHPNKRWLQHAWSWLLAFGRTVSRLVQSNHTLLFRLCQHVCSLFLDFMANAAFEHVRLSMCSLRERRRCVVVLLCGTSGSGKSTLASILVRAQNCVLCSSMFSKPQLQSVLCLAAAACRRMQLCMIQMLSCNSRAELTHIQG